MAGKPWTRDLCRIGGFVRNGASGGGGFQVGEFAQLPGGQLAHLHEGAHDGDVPLHGTLTVQYAGEHGDALLGEDVREIPPAAAASRF